MLFIKTNYLSMNLSKRIKKTRIKNGLTQLDLSKKSGLTLRTIQRIENGIYVPSTVLALKIAKTLKCKVEDLFELPD